MEISRGTNGRPEDYEEISNIQPKRRRSIGSPQLRWRDGVGGNVILKWILQKYDSSFDILLLCRFNFIDVLITMYKHIYIFLYS
jgi:hypothetical protein